MLLEGKTISGRYHGNDMAITVSLWLCDFYAIRNQLRQPFSILKKSLIRFSTGLA